MTDATQSGATEVDPELDVVDYLRARMCELENGIRAVREQWHGDDKCFLDLFTLFEMLPEGFVRPVRDSTVDLENCQRFISRCHQPGPDYVSPQRRIEELESEIAKRNEIMLHGINFGPETKGAIDMRVGGEPALMFIYTLVEFFYGNGGKNFVTLTVETPVRYERSAAHLEITVRNCDGKLTPAEEIANLKSKIKELEGACQTSPT